ncbi:hypothetical protein F3Y22_tig00111330pilonHSYRG00320 [Hibiscus syriacus]|uniref:Uncharacterized protein n=1 Tax=Hibiscus syriacus TaxID=106335 RepID=A0A6A2YPW4_HIBSY|nr:hypothetical protein F3Y22_tig00111330pilonHSYRG00320 [Hibiscus syriacus]
MHRIVLQREIRSRASHTDLSWFNSSNLYRSVHSLPFATVEAEAISGSQPAEGEDEGEGLACSFLLSHNLLESYVVILSPYGLHGKWKESAAWNTLVDPLNGEPFIKVAEIDESGVQVCPLDVMC